MALDYQQELIDTRKEIGQNLHGPAKCHFDLITHGWQANHWFLVIATRGTAESTYPGLPGTLHKRVLPSLLFQLRSEGFLFFPLPFSFQIPPSPPPFQSYVVYRHRKIHPANLLPNLVCDSFIWQFYKQLLSLHLRLLIAPSEWCPTAMDLSAREGKNSHNTNQIH